MSATRERRRSSARGHSLAMVLSCVASIAVLALVFAAGLPKWLVIAALLVCAAVLVVTMLAGRVDTGRGRGRRGG